MADTCPFCEALKVDIAKLEARLAKLEAVREAAEVIVNRFPGLGWTKSYEGLKKALAAVEG